MEILTSLDDCYRYLAEMQIGGTLMPSDPLEIGCREVDLSDYEHLNLKEFTISMLTKYPGVPVLLRKDLYSPFIATWITGYIIEKTQELVQTTYCRFNFRESTIYTLDTDKILEMRRTNKQTLGTVSAFDN